MDGRNQMESWDDFWAGVTNENPRDEGTKEKRRAKEANVADNDEKEKTNIWRGSTEKLRRQKTGEPGNKTEHRDNFEQQT